MRLFVALNSMLLLAVFACVEPQGEAVGTDVTPSADVTLTLGLPEDVGMSSAVLREGLELYENAVEQGDLVGAVILVAKDGKVVMYEAVGWRDKANGKPMEPNTMFRMASNTKPVIATALSTLVEYGRIAYDDFAHTYIPTFDNEQSGSITVDQLLSHTSGLRINTLFLSPLSEPSPEHPDAPTLQTEVARFGEVGAEEPPGEYSYNNPGFNTLGALIEITSGRMLEDYLREEIYEPLGMVDSYHHELAEKLDGKLDRMSVVYYEREGDEWTPGWSPGDPAQVPFVRASGGMISTAWDYAVFCQMYLNGGVYGGARILGPETIGVITSPKSDRIGGTDENPAFYGYGWRVTGDGIFGHGGSDGTNAWVDPENQIIGLVFTQTPRGENPLAQFREIVRQSLMESP